MFGCSLTWLTDRKIYQQGFTYIININYYFYLVIGVDEERVNYTLGL